MQNTKALIIAQNASWVSSVVKLGRAYAFSLRRVKPPAKITKPAGYPLGAGLEQAAQAAFVASGRALKRDGDQIQIVRISPIKLGELLAERISVGPRRAATLALPAVLNHSIR
jgi:hypothetical protein